MMSRLSLFAAFSLASLLCCAGVALPSRADAAEAPEKDWLEFYYENPTPEQFIPRLKDWAADGTLDNEHARPALIAFISQLIRQNEETLPQWYTDLSGLTPSQLQVMHTAMLFSRTAAADRIMREVFGRIYEEQKRETPKILELPLDKEATMDMLWGYYYATGSEGAIRRIVSAFRFVDAPEDPPGVDVPEGYVPLYKALPQFASGSLIANGERHPRVVAILRELQEKDESLVEVEKKGIQEVLSALDPPPKDA